MKIVTKLKKSLKLFVMVMKDIIVSNEFSKN